MPPIASAIGSAANTKSGFLVNIGNRNVRGKIIPSLRVSDSNTAYFGQLRAVNPSTIAYWNARSSSPAVLILMPIEAALIIALSLVNILEKYDGIVIARVNIIALNAKHNTNSLSIVPLILSTLPAPRLKLKRGCAPIVIPPNGFMTNCKKLTTIVAAAR